MPRIPIFRFGLGQSSEETVAPRLGRYTPTLSLGGLQLGVDNLRHDVDLSTKFCEHTRWQIARLIARHGDVESLLAAEEPAHRKANDYLRNKNDKSQSKTETSDLKPLLAEIHISALNRAKSDGNSSLDLLARVAIIKFLRTELHAQYGQILERCQVTLKNCESYRHQKALEYRERVGAFQVAKKTILRKTSQELFRTLREIEKENLSRMRRSLLSTKDEPYKLFLNPLMFTEDGFDTYLNADQYVMLGNFDRDPDRFGNVRRIACEFLQSVEAPSESESERILNEWLNVPENAQELVGSGAPEESTPEGRSRRTRLQNWVDLLEHEKIMEYAVASYETVPLLAEYSPHINAQQLKHALIFREERARVEKLIAERGKGSPASLLAAADRVANCRSAERMKIACRFLRDLMRYHRDLRQLEVLNSAIESVNLIANDKIRQLSAMNGTLYQYLLPEEQKPVEDKLARHVVLKADVRDSSRLTRSLLERTMNPASYFSLNFYDPVNKLLPKYAAHKVFLEGDAIILALLEREGESGQPVGRAAVLAHEMLDIVSGYNQMLERSGLPTIELGIGISYQDSAPMYLLDGEQRIMISDALNESDRLSSCSKRVRKAIQSSKSPFRVYAFQTVSDADIQDSPDDFLLRYNVGGIRMSAAAFEKLKHEITLEDVKLSVPSLRPGEECRLWSGVVPVSNGIFRKIVVRGSRIAQIDPHDLSVTQWTDHWYYEVCSNPTIYAKLEDHAAAGR